PPPTPPALFPYTTLFRSHPRVRQAKQAGFVALVGGTALYANLIRPSQRVLLSSVLLWALMGLSLVVLTGYAGQVSLGHYAFVARSEEHTSELQSPYDLVC